MTDVAAKRPAASRNGREAAGCVGNGREAAGYVRNGREAAGCVRSFCRTINKIDKGSTKA